PEESLQWQAFQQAIEVLRRRRNQVFVLLGPFNEHMLAAPSLTHYRSLKASIGIKLDELQLPYLAPQTLPSDLYGDASHPLAEGYNQLAKRLWADHGFWSWATNRAVALAAPHSAPK